MKETLHTTATARRRTTWRGASALAVLGLGTAVTLFAASPAQAADPAPATVGAGVHLAHGSPTSGGARISPDGDACPGREC